MSFPAADTLMVTALDHPGGPYRYRVSTGEPMEGSLAATNSCANGASVQSNAGKDRTAVREMISGRIVARMPFAANGTTMNTTRMSCSADRKTGLFLGLDSARKSRPELWDLSTGKRLRILGDGKREVWLVALSPDGRMAATVDEGASVVRLWDTTSGSELRQLTGMPEVTADVAATGGRPWEP